VRRLLAILAVAVLACATGACGTKPGPARTPPTVGPDIQRAWTAACPTGCQHVPGQPDGEDAPPADAVAICASATLPGFTEESVVVSVSSGLLSCKWGDGITPPSAGLDIAYVDRVSGSGDPCRPFPKDADCRPIPGGGWEAGPYASSGPPLSGRWWVSSATESVEASVVFTGIAEDQVISAVRALETAGLAAAGIPVPAN